MASPFYQIGSKRRHIGIMSIRQLARKMPILLTALYLGVLFSGCNKKAEDEKTETPTPTTAPDPIFNVLGYGYDPVTDYMNVTSARARVVDMDKLRAISADRVIIRDLDDETAESNAAEDIKEYSRVIDLSGDIHYQAILFSKYKSSFTFIDSVAIYGRYVYGTYQDYIKKRQLRIVAPVDLLKTVLTDAFKEDARTQTAEYLVKNYGVCILQDIILGGRLEVVYWANTTNTDRRTSASAGLTHSVKEVFGININGSTNTSLLQQNSDQHLYYRTVGGNSSIPLIGTIDLTANPTNKIQIDDWHNSITRENAQLINVGSTNGMILLSDLIEDPAKAAEVYEYIRQYLIANQIIFRDAPDQIHAYLESTNGRHAYSSQKLPSIHGSYNWAASVFKGYSQSKYDAVPIFEQYEAGKNVWRYTQSSAPLPNCTVGSVAFYAFKTQVPGSVPVYEFYYENVHNQHMNYDYWYMTDPTVNSQDEHFVGIAFYAYP